MPYSDISEMPKYTHKYSPKARRQMMHVFNSVYKKVLEETGKKDKAEKRAFKAMHSVFKKRFKNKESNWSKNEPDYINHLIDQFLGNLEG